MAEFCVLLLVKKYYDSHCNDKEVLVDIQKVIDSSPELIEPFIAGINDVGDAMTEWHDYVAEERERQLTDIIQTEKLKAFFERFFGVG